MNIDIFVHEIMTDFMLSKRYYINDSTSLMHKSLITAAVTGMLMSTAVSENYLKPVTLTLSHSPLDIMLRKS